MYPNGYNKRWNTSKYKDIEKNEIEEFKIKKKTKELKVIIPIQTTQKYERITNNQWSVYFYLLSKSHYDENMNRHVYISEISPKKISTFFNFTARSYYNAIESLEKKGLITISKEDITFSAVEFTTSISKELLSYLIYNTKSLGIDLLRVYLIIKELMEKFDITELTTRKIVKYLGHSDKRTEYYDRVQIYMDLFANWKLIDFHTEQQEMPNIGKYKVYIIDRVYDTTDELQKLLGNSIEKKEEN